MRQFLVFLLTLFSAGIVPAVAEQYPKDHFKGKTFKLLKTSYADTCTYTVTASATYDMGNGKKVNSITYYNKKGVSIFLALEETTLIYDQKVIRDYYVKDSIRTVARDMTRFEFPYGFAYIDHFTQDDRRTLKPTIVWKCLNEAVKIKTIEFGIKVLDKSRKALNFDYPESAGNYTISVEEANSWRTTADPIILYSGEPVQVVLTYCKVMTYDDTWHKVGINDKHADADLGN